MRGGGSQQSAQSVSQKDAGHDDEVDLSCNIGNKTATEQTNNSEGRREGEDFDGEELPSARSVCVCVSETCLSVQNGPTSFRDSLE